MSSFTRVAAFELTRTPGGVAAIDGDFDLDTYSRMKHGDMRAIAAMGETLTQSVLSGRRELVLNPAPVVLPVAYLHVPPACYYLAQHVAHAITRERAAVGLPRSRVVKISKDSVTATDYATATASERAAEMSRISFSLDEPVAGAHVVLVDDVRVTGLAEKTALDSMSGQSSASVTAAYVAVVDETLASDPSVEARLNHATVRSVADMAEAARSGQMVLTIRFLKRLLAADPAERAGFLSECPQRLLAEMVDGAVGSGPQFVATYAPGLADLERWRVRGLTP